MREASSSYVQDLKKENEHLKQSLTEVLYDVRTSWTSIKTLCCICIGSVLSKQIVHGYRNTGYAAGGIARTL